MNRELKYNIPWFGTDLQQLVGVVLFNFAFAITVPAWLNEKLPDVSVAPVIWSAVTLNTALYLALGVLGGMSYSDPKSDMLILLSGKDAAPYTRCCAVRNMS